MAFARSLTIALVCLSLSACDLRHAFQLVTVPPAEPAAKPSPEPIQLPPDLPPVGAGSGNQGPTGPQAQTPETPAAMPRIISPPRIINGPVTAKPKAVASQPVKIVTPPAEPKWSGVVLRLEFLFPEKNRRHSGTGFIVRDHSGACYLLTCAHLVDKKDWESRHSVTMRFMNNSMVIQSLGPSLYVGTPVDLKHLGADGRPDLTHDFVIRSVVGRWARPLPLARTDPKVGEMVWAVGCEGGKPVSDEKLFAGEIVEVVGGGYTLRKQVAFDPRGFSGGPVINRSGQVIGNVLAGGGDFISGATVGTIRKRLREKGIVID